MPAERLQKILAQVGIASRRQAEEFISEGLVTVNGKIAKLGDKATLGKDAIKFKNRLLTNPESLVYIAFHKPRGVISMLTDPEDRPNLSNYLTKIKTRVFPVGRLDFNSDGLILLTNDGDLANQIQKSDLIARTYVVKVKGEMDEEMLARLRRPYRPKDAPNERSFKAHSVEVVQKLQSKTQVKVVLIGSGNFNLKALFEARGFLVEKVSRTRIGHLRLRAMKPGQYRFLEKSQVSALLEQPELGLKD